MATIFHVTTHHEWALALRRGRHEAPSLMAAGFIHCSNGDQVTRVANSIFRGMHGLVLLHIAVDRLTSPVVYENLDNGAELFPHVYGPIDLAAARLRGQRVAAQQTQQSGPVEGTASLKHRKPTHLQKWSWPWQRPSPLTVRVVVESAILRRFEGRDVLQWFLRLA